MSRSAFWRAYWLTLQTDSLPSAIADEPAYHIRRPDLSPSPEKEQVHFSRQGSMPAAMQDDQESVMSSMFKDQNFGPSLKGF